MIVTIQRFDIKDKWTFGKLLIDNEMICYTLEDKVREKGAKIWGETAIPYGTYKIVFRTVGKLYELYKDKFSYINNKRGMLNIIGIEGFGGDVMFHCGNTIYDTAGCPLLGMSIEPNTGTITRGKSQPAYEIAYQRIADAVEKDGYVTLNVIKE